MSLVGFALSIYASGSPRYRLRANRGKGEEE
nr:MAG TPA: hypothetical protein [Caudoviricetes sp.]